jgi:hypothetical protein
MFNRNPTDLTADTMVHLEQHRVFSLLFCDGIACDILQQSEGRSKMYLPRQTNFPHLVQQ